MDKLIFLFGLVAIALAHAQDVVFPYQYDFFNRLDYEESPLGKKIDTATMKLLKEAYNSAEDKNVVSSPLNLMILLSLYNIGAGPETKEEITSFLGGADFLLSYRHLSEGFADLNPEALIVANKMYVSDKYNLNDHFAFVADGFRIGVEKLNFSNTDAAAATINQWANEKTKGNIKDPVSPSMLSEDIAAGLFNVINFKGHWHAPFKAEDTQDKDFHVSKDSVVKKPTMRLTQSLFYAESSELGARLVELPYTETGFRMVIVLPNEVDGLSSLLDKAAKKGILDEVFKLSSPLKKVELELPKFHVKSKLDFNEILPKVGVSKLFEEPANGIVQNQTVVVTKAFQEAFIKVDEEGATAGAYTGYVLEPMSFEIKLDLLQFKVDHPFLYSILYKDKVIFAGTYTH